jgi:hemerythrin-like domain-containing protein
VTAEPCHHAKEEKDLFPRMEGRGLPRQQGPLAVMLVEHELGLA